MDAGVIVQHFQGVPDVDAVWLFGSRARGDARPNSDVDVAVLFARGLAVEAATFRRGRLMDELSARLRLPVDVVDVERVQPRLFAALYRDAQLLLERDRQHRVDAVARQYALWHDMQAHEDLRRQSLKAGLRR